MVLLIGRRLYLNYLSDDRNALKQSINPCLETTQTVTFALRQ